VPLGVRGADEAPLVAGHPGAPGDGARQHRRLVEAALAFTFGVERHRHDARRAVERRPTLRLTHQPR
jgi:hypothetical protein